MRSFRGYGSSELGCVVCGAVRIRKAAQQGETRSAVLPRLSKTSAKILKVLDALRERVERVVISELTKSSASLSLLTAGPRRRPPTSQAQRILDAVNVDGFSVLLAETITDDLEEVFSAAGLRAVMVARLGSEPTAAALEQMDQAALDFAEERAAYLVGRQRTKDGNVRENPNPRYSISDVARDEIRSVVAQAVEAGWGTDRIKQQLLDAHAFSSARAETIARTELAFAHTSGNLRGWSESGRVGGKRSILADTHPFEDVCDENEKVGTVGLNDEFPSGDQAPPYHPNCLCDVVAVLKSEMPALLNEEDEVKEKVYLGALLRKHNPYHDAEGKFTTADQAIERLGSLPKTEGPKWFKYGGRDDEVHVRELGFKYPGKVFGFSASDKKKFADLDVELKEIYAAQPVVRVEGVERKIRGQDRESEHDPVTAVRMDGRVYLQQGHHRVAAAMLQGAPSMKVRVIDAEEIGYLKIRYTKPKAVKYFTPDYVLEKMNPYRKPAGTPEGGRWTSPDEAGWHESMTPEQVAVMIPRSPNLTQEQRDAEEELVRIISSDVRGALAAYDALPEAEGGKILNTDVARELSPTYRASLENRARFAAAVHEPASWLMAQKYNIAVRSPDTTSDVGAGIITFLAGGGGSGKSSATSIPGVREIVNRSQLVVDSTMSSYRSSAAKVDQALDNGKYVNLVFVARDPYESYMQGVVTRALRSGRTVPYEVAATQHKGATDTFKALVTKLEGNPRASHWVVDNTHGVSGARAGDTKTLDRLNYERIQERIRYGLESEHDAGRIPGFVYEGLTGSAPRSARKVHGGDYGGVRERGQQEGDRQSVLLGSRLRPTHISKRKLVASLLSANPHITIKDTTK